MKKIYSIVALMLASSMAFSQTQENPHEIRVAFGVQDSYGPFSGKNFPFGIWNTKNLDKTGQIRYSKYINEFVDWGVTVSQSDTEHIYDNDFSGNPLNIGSVFDLDLIAKYKFNNGIDFKEDALLKPYIYTGIGGSYISALDNVRNVDNGLGLNVPVGTGLKVNFAEKVNLDLNGAFRVGLFDKIPNRWEHTAGLSFNLGKAKAAPVVEEIVMPEPVIEEVVEEPVVVETPEPEVVEVEEVVEVVPAPPAPPADSDNDGVIDSEDNCPNVYGVASNNGCPKPAPVVVDTDGDGIIDTQDNCPNVYGDAAHNGCPKPAPVVVDTDGDGIIDPNDNCPNVYGVASNNGCPKPAPIVTAPVIAPAPVVVPQPVVEQQVQAKVEQISRNIFFETASSTLKTSSKVKLNELVNIMRDYGNYNLSVEGHTDNTGSSTLNQTLSEKRAASVRNYLVSKGIDSTRISSAGYGQNRPIADNNTAEGRRQNRRVELKLTLRR